MMWAARKQFAPYPQWQEFREESRIGIVIRICIKNSTALSQARRRIPRKISSEFVNNFLSYHQNSYNGPYLSRQKGKYST